MLRSIQSFPYHLVEPSPYPIITSFALLTTTLSGVISIHGFSYGPILVLLGFLSTLLCITLWFKDITREGTFSGNHTIAVQKGLNLGFILFVASEVIFFVSIFWAYFHSALAPTVDLGSIWPPAGIEPLNPFEIPLLNTVLLLSSGATVTYAHHCLIQGNRAGTIYGLIGTIVLAIAFTSLQGYEYVNASFTIADSAYGSTFFIATGFHGLHVIIGTIFITVSLIRIIAYHFTDHHHVGLEVSILYWHFVDVVWLFLYACVYLWAY